mmetsp:Transcript_33917/g.34550  ORF Transcript_33917/g.34550 Transcript_33917/m.34550 type:complete len:492 (+) Transcript_33917:197-1672(+)|eukprot:CAMPEP_0182421010 /NCGR_PEP_ID=MMETSP1167-20130531/6165_1 /TAXON_ID=2988 /ORGANISM="Mallomonas Sp, Strain CCMP3275" /LENGTH=491 /DNA_ID=CAMNT_0024597679 /DNA_START=113 /DNA_END=1588 /DNA_ORIENTATION=+
MGPKKLAKKGKKSKSGKDEENVEMEGSASDQAEWKSLKTEADRLYKLTQKEEHDFNEFQQQREKLNYFWIVEKKKLEDKRAELRNKERELQDLEEKNQVEIKIYKQRLKHLLHEHQNEMTRKKTEGEMALKMAQDDDREGERDIKEDNRALNITSKEIQLTHDEYIRSLKREQDQKITMLRHEFERKANELQKMFEARMKKTREHLDSHRKEEIKAIEERKHKMIETLMAEHQKAFADIKNYYNDITHNNLDLIKSLKEEVKGSEADERKQETNLHVQMQENKKLSAPLKKKQEEAIRLHDELEEYKKEKAEMRRVKSGLVVVEDNCSTLSWEYEVLQQRYIELKKERDDLKRHFMATVFDVKQKSAFQGLLLEKKLAAMQRIQEEKEAQLNEVLSRANLEPAVLGEVRGRVGDVLHRKNEETQHLQAEVSRLRAYHEHLQTSIAQKMKEFGLSAKDLGFVPASHSNLKDTRVLATRGGTSSFESTFSRNL